MAEQFDPYRKWLGIPSQDQAPNHYQLLGIPSGENDADVIENAANRQMAHVRTFQAGKHSKLSQQILNELSTAKRVLLTSDKKSAYDAQLAAQQQASATSLTRPPAIPPVAQAPALSPAPAETSVPDTGIRPRGGRGKISRRHRRRQRKSSSFPILVGIVAVAILVGVIMLLANRKKNSDVQNSDSASQEVSMISLPWNQVA